MERQEEHIVSCAYVRCWFVAHFFFFNFSRGRVLICISHFRPTSFERLVFAAEVYTERSKREHAELIFVFGGYMPIKQIERCIECTRRTGIPAA